MTEKPHEPVTLFKLSCPHCKGHFTATLTRSQLKRYIRDIDREARKQRGKK